MINKNIHTLRLMGYCSIQSVELILRYTEYGCGYYSIHMQFVIQECGCGYYSIHSLLYKSVDVVIIVYTVCYTRVWMWLL